MEGRANYLIDPIEEIGNGGYGVVEKIKLFNTSHHLCGLYARKLLTSGNSDKDVYQRFIREIKAQCDCLHNNIVQIFITNLEAQKPWFIMELAKHSLDDEIKSGTMTTEDKIKVLKDVLNGLLFIHNKGYLHRDIKPQNILKFNNGTYKLSDFGLAKSMTPSKSQFVTRVGEFYGSPEFFDYGVMAHGYSKQSDIYSIGVLIEHLNIDETESIIIKCKHKQLNKRYINVEQVISQISLLEEGL
ncbi:protein kinase domain-containing protein [Klebsiella pneumoniae]